jgi:hypothetical protein
MSEWSGAAQGANHQAMSDDGMEEYDVDRPDVQAVASESAPAEPARGPATATGHQEVDRALAALAEVADAPPADQVGPLAAAHEVLRETLDAIGRADAVR